METDTPAGIDPHEWHDWGDEARYVFHERMGMAQDLEVPRGQALSVAVREARAAHEGER